jgi:phosphatidylglycerol---prolipoprotein diacylglyceryl transferase
VIPFLHFGSLAIPTFGLSVACAMLVAYFVLRADLARRGIADPQSGEAETLVASPCLAGFIGAKLYHLLESPAEFFADPWHLLLSPYGFAWFGGLLAGFATFAFVAWRLVQRNAAEGKSISFLTILDAGSPAAAIGYGIGRIGCFLSGDGDYGIPTALPWGMSFPNGLVPTTARVHPTPIYELIVACAIAWFLWRMGAHSGTTQTGAPGKSSVPRVPDVPGVSSAPDATAPPSQKITPSERPARMEKKPASASAASITSASRMEQKSQEKTGLAHATNMAPASAPASAPAPASASASAFAAAIAPGKVFAMYLIFTGLARFLVEFIRINPRSFFGLSNAQAAGALSALLGIALYAKLRQGKPTHTQT